MFYSGLVQTLGILLTFTELGVGGGGVTGLKEISSSGLTSGFSENMHSQINLLRKKLTSCEHYKKSDLLSKSCRIS